MRAYRGLFRVRVPWPRALEVEQIPCPHRAILRGATDIDSGMLALMGSMKIGAVAVAVFPALTLAGCASGSGGEATPTPTETVSANVAACDAFVEVTSTMSDALNTDGNVNDAWADVRAEMDAAALQASGEVKDRIDSLVDDWPSATDLWIGQDFDGINQALEDVGRACDADGAPVDVYTFVTD